MWPPATNQAFHVKSILISKFMWQRINLEPGGALLPSSRILKAGRTCFISFAIASAQNVVPVSLSISSALFIVFGSSIPNLKSFLRCFALVRMLATILFYFSSERMAPTMQMRVPHTDHWPLHILQLLWGCSLLNLRVFPKWLSLLSTGL
jgi:hypothetical protein